MKEIVLTNGMVTLVDDGDYEKLMICNWMMDVNGYAYTKRYPGCSKQTIFMHRIITGAPDGMAVDHRNRVKLDNRSENLRIVNNSQNCWNSGPRQHTSKYKGVSWDKRCRLWRVSISVNGKAKNCGRYKTQDEAARIYNLMAEKSYGEYAYLNTI